MPVILHPDSTCDICLEHFSESLPPHAIPCGHIFCEPCFQNENYRPHLCALCRQPYHPDRTKRLHVELKYGPRMSPRTHTEGEELVDYNADGVPRRTRLPTDLMLVVKLATALDLRPEVPAKQLRSVLKQATRWRDENVHNPSGLALKNLLRFVEEYRYASSRCHQLEDQLEALQVPEQTVILPSAVDYSNTPQHSSYSSPGQSSQSDNGDLVKAIWDELTKTRDRVEDLTKEMQRMKTTSHPQNGVFSPSGMWPIQTPDEYVPVAYPPAVVSGPETPYTHANPGQPTTEIRRSRSDETPHSEYDEQPVSVRATKSTSSVSTAATTGSATPPRGAKRAQSVRFQYPPHSTSPPPPSDTAPQRPPSPTTSHTNRRPHHHRSRTHPSEPMPPVPTPHHHPVSLSEDAQNGHIGAYPSSPSIQRYGEDLDAQSAVSGRTAMTWGTVSSANTLYKLPLAQLPMSRSTASRPIEGRLLS